MAEPITITLPLWQWLALGLGWFVGGVLGNITGDWLTGKTKPKSLRNWRVAAEAEAERVEELLAENTALVAELQRVLGRALTWEDWQRIYPEGATTWQEEAV